MAQTRFFDDPARIAANLELQTQAGRYMLNAPANGENMPYLEDVHTRLQHWGANLDARSLELENDLRGLYRPIISKDAFIHVYKNMPPEYSQRAGDIFAGRYQTEKPYTDESRASHPAWMYRSMDDKRTFDVPPPLNPQTREATEVSFQYNIQTRILEKDAFESRFGAPSTRSAAAAVPYAREPAPEPVGPGVL
jgi:hypothetical protein